MAERSTRSRAFWSGTITFGLVSVPVDLYSANRRRRVSLRMLAPDGTPLERQYFCAREDERISWSEIIRGYELDDGSYVPITDEELEALEPEKSRDIDLRKFVPRENLDPMLFRRAYFLVPGGDSVKAYRLLVDAMESSDRAGIATFVMRGKEYLVAIIAEEGLLRAETLRFADEVRDIDDVGLPDVEGNASDVKAFRKAVNGLTKKTVDLDELQDDWSERVVEYARKKKKEGKDVVERAPLEDEAPEESGGGEVIDLVEALKRSLGKEAVKSGPKKAKRKRAKKSDLEEMTKDQLYELAQEKEIEGRSSMTKAELIDALS